MRDTTVGRHKAPLVGAHQGGIMRIGMEVRARVATLALCCAAVALTSCADTTATPSAANAPPQLDPVAVLPSSSAFSFEAVPGSPVSVPNNDADPHNPIVTSSGPTFAKRTLVRITASGTITTARTPHWYAGGSTVTPVPGNYGPRGIYVDPNNGCATKLIVGSTSSQGGETWMPPCISGPVDTSAAIGYAYLAGASNVSRGAAVPGTNGQWDCHSPAAGYGPCNTYTSNGQSVAIDRVVGTLSVTASPTTVNYNDTVTVTATVSAPPTPGKTMEWTIDSTTWAPAFGTQWAPCNWSHFVPNNNNQAVTRVCKKPFTRSGTLTVYATVNAEKLQSPPIAIIVTPPKLKVTATPTIIQSTASVTFQASLTPTTVTNWSPSGWTWRPDVGTGGIAPNNCNWWDKTCTRTISKQGWMKATATVGEYTLADSVKVWLIPCPTGDSIVDNPDLRMALIAHQDSSPTDGGGKERGGLVVRNFATQRDSIVHLPNLTRGSCYVAWPFQLQPLAPPGYIVIAFWHTHWAPNGFNCTDPQGNSWAADRGLSKADWSASNILNCPLYTIDRSKIWRINPTVAGPNQRNYNRKIPQRGIDRSPSTTNCVTWPAVLPNENFGPYTC